MTGETGDGAFAQALAGLKRRGSGLLVVGAARHEAHLGACRRLLGDAGEDRRRLVVLTDSVPGGEARTDADAGLRVIDRRPTARSAAASERSGIGTAPNDLHTLRRETLAAIEAFDAEAEGLAPAQLRVCLDSLRPLLDVYDERTVREFVRAVVEATREVGGMCHVHLPAEGDSAAVDSVADLFNATVEVRTVRRDGNGAAPSIEQRWQLHDPEVATDWLPL